MGEYFSHLMGDLHDTLSGDQVFDEVSNNFVNGLKVKLVNNYKY